MADWQAHYYDGQTANREAVTVSFATGGLTIHREGRGSIWWAYRETRPGQGSIDGGPVRIERTDGVTEVLVFADPRVFDAIRSVDPSAPYGRSPRSGALWKSLAGLAVATVLVMVAFYVWLLPWVGEIIAARIPVSMEEKLGESVVRQLTLFETVCTDETVHKPVEEIANALAARIEGNPYKLRVYVVDGPLVNAFAAPGGSIVVYRGLIAKTKSPDELAGVLAHELTHVMERHGSKAMMRGIALWAILSFLTGDASGTVAGMVGALEQLRFSREQEVRADEGAMKLFEKARIAPGAMTHVFRALEKETEVMPKSKALTYLSTHPDMEDRIRSIEKWASRQHYTSTAILSVGSWPPSFQACKAQAR